MSRAQHLVLYDGDCAMCQFQVRTLTWLDWFNVLSFVPISDPRAAQAVPQLTQEQLLEAIHCLTTDGRLHRGARAIRFIGMRLPLLVIVALVMWIPGVIWIAEHIYIWVARHRHVLSRLFGCKDACAVLPARRREQDSGLQPRPQGLSGTKLP
jgi:predicted DCC family thiol-disulfide oxidoreductase YuxK